MAQNPVFVKQGSAACELPNPTGVDHVFIFSDMTDVEIGSAANADWYRYNNGDSTFLQSGVDYLYLTSADNNSGFIVHMPGKRVVFWVIDYSQYRLNFRSVGADLDYDEQCTETRLVLDADIPEMSYQNIYGSKLKITRSCAIEYTSLAWGEDQWVDTTIVEDVNLNTSLVITAPLRNTTFTVRADQFLTMMNLPQDSIVSDTYSAVAVAAHPTTITTIRGSEQENMNPNEIERPIDSDFLKGSAPLDILFKANANTPVAQYYQWKILKGTDLIVQRTDAEHRYTFDDFGEFRVLLWVSNGICTTDSFEISVSVSASKLLVPNVFTPNGDGKNDEFRVSYRSIVEFDCWVYNRWGKLIYHWNDPAKGWDGNIHGRPAAEGAYFYVIRAKGADAESGADYVSHIKDKKAKKKGETPVGVYQLAGDINLIRGEK